MATINGRQVRNVARERGGKGVLTDAFAGLTKLSAPLTTPSVSRIARSTTPPVRAAVTPVRAAINDSAQIRHRQEAEQLPEGGVRRRKMGAF